LRLISAATVDDMVLAFLSAEANSARWGNAFANLDRRLINEPDLTDAAQNTARADALAVHRGDVRTRTGFFQGLPLDTRWQRWALTPVELGNFLYANYVTWIKLSGGTRRIRDGAANVDKLQCYENGKDINAGIRATARAIDDGKPMVELIAVSQGVDGRDRVLLEGHTRATAYVIARHPPGSVTVLVGWSASMDRWRWF
jgi:hypothetical protein